MYARLIQFQGRNITLADASHVFSRTLGAGTRENLAINAADSVKLSGASLIETSAEGEGRAGDVLVRASNFIQFAETSFEQLGGLYSQVCGDISTDCAKSKK
ncbi:MAG TPA: hypothetical protein DDW76_34535 [Cyanobacteria bacterium UBA11369]|nr:hypothetical protein [Cyanobacteria bacterium UBA11371]HBE33610.1 hypothetical protein [Cyanobacteria bacterium UBA11368]HBE53732.1 hypothetical protein [Cyanobacteria bacterium UBA11369]